MESTESVSKGVFAFRGNKAASEKSRAKTADPLDSFEGEGWFDMYRKVWKRIEKKLESLEDDVTEKLLSEMANFISNTPNQNGLIPTATLLTGVNLPDHGSLFHRLSAKLKNAGNADIALLRAVECPSVRHMVEQMVGQCIRQSWSSPNDKMEDLLEEYESEEEMEDSTKLKRKDLTMPYLLDWYQKKISECPSPNKRCKKNNGVGKLVIILSEFEAFPASAVKDFILILSGYATTLPIVLVMGVATTIGALNNSLPHSATSRLSLQLFQSQPSVYFLNNTLEKVFLTSDCPFQLGPKVFKFLTDVFLFYDFSVHGFTQGIKYCLMEHFYQQPPALFCCKNTKLEDVMKKMNHNDMESLRKSISFRSFVEGQQKPEQIALLTSDTHLKKTALKLIKNLKDKIYEFHACLRLLKILVAELPQAPLGKNIRDYYPLAVTGEICDSQHYKECVQLLGFHAKNELVEKLDKLIDYLNSLDSKREWVNTTKSKITDLKQEFECAELTNVTKSPTKSPRKLDMNVKNRAQLRQKLVELGKVEKKETKYELTRRKVIEYLSEDLLPSGLEGLVKLPLHETILVDPHLAIKKRLVGAPRAALHTALNNPQYYLQCDCCNLEHHAEIRGSMPDICVAYKLHLECGALINMYDWLIAFVTIIDPESVLEDKKNIDQKLQARFSQAVAELEFLGFIKSSKRKTDHVSRLTWGGTN